jgi:ribonuclease-3
MLRYFSSQDRKFNQALKNLLGFYPRNITLYRQAFRHRSSAIELHNKQKSSNERLEFLGDAVISTVVADMLFKRFPYKDEGFLTEMRSKIVSRDQLNKLALKLGIVDLIETAEDTNQRNRSINGDAFEALIGAIYLDQGYSRTQLFILNRIIKVHIDVDALETTETNFKSRLIEWAQRERKAVAFEVLDEVGNKNSRQLKVQVTIDGNPMGMGIDFSKKKAEQIAAEATCKSLNI